MIEAALISRLSSGSYTYLDTDKVFVNRVPQDIDLPYCFMFRPVTEMLRSKDSSSHIDTASIKINVLSNLLQTCENWASEIRTRLDGLEDFTAEGSTISKVWCTGKDYIFLDEIDTHIMTLDFEVMEVR